MIEQPIKVLTDIKKKDHLLKVAEVAHLLKVVNASYRLDAYAKLNGNTQAVYDVDVKEDKILFDGKSFSVREFKRVTNANSFDFIFIYKVRNV